MYQSPIVSMRRGSRALRSTCPFSLAKDRHHAAGEDKIALLVRARVSEH